MTVACAFHGGFSQHLPWNMTYNMAWLSTCATIMSHNDMYMYIVYTCACICVTVCTQLQLHTMSVDTMGRDGGGGREGLWGWIRKENRVSNSSIPACKKLFLK